MSTKKKDSISLSPCRSAMGLQGYKAYVLMLPQSVF
nr:MAG TPA: hypothetical protein [Bacteriophage sp.]